jgi:hypothetical protein
MNNRAQTSSQIANYIKFKDLSKQMQERLLKRQQGNDEGFAFKTAGISSAPFFIAAAIVWLAMVLYFANDYLWSNFQIGFFGLVSLGAIYLLLYNLYKLFRWFTSPSKSYLLITPLYVIETRFNDVWYWDLDQLNAANVERQNQGGENFAAKVKLSFEGGATKSFAVKSVGEAEQTIEQIYYYKKLFIEATARNDAEYLNSNNDFLELKNQPQQLKTTVPNSNITKILTAAASLILTGGLMFGMVALNNYYDDKKSWDNAEAINRATSYRIYQQTHPQGRWLSDAQQKIQNLYNAAEQKYQNSLNKDYDQNAVDAVLQTIKYAKTTQNYHVQIIFERHNEISPNIVEELKKDYGVKKILPFDDTFSEAKMIRRESNLFSVVTDAFKQVIPDDILEFSRECGGECVTFLVKYKVSSDSIYYDPREKKLPEVDRVWNPGIFIDWDFSVRTPNQPQSYDFSLESLPADHITYDSDLAENLSGKVDVEKEMQTDKNNMYDEMVSSAFDDFRKNLVYRMGIGAEPTPPEAVPEDEKTPVNDGEIREL